MAAGTGSAQLPEDTGGCLAPPNQVQRGSLASPPPRGRYSDKAPAGIGMPERDGGRPGTRPVRTAFYGRTNAVGEDAALAMVRQFRQCQDAAGHAVIDGAFYDAAGGVSQALTEMVRQLEPLAARDGGWSDLTAQITSAGHPVTMIVCVSPDRIARRPAVRGPADGSPQRVPAVIRAAFAGRTSTYDQQDPTLSLPRQLRASQDALLDDAVIVAHFYDVESGREDLADRGHGRAHEQFQIPIPRDGGIADAARGSPLILRVREDQLLDGLARFLSDKVFGPRKPHRKAQHHADRRHDRRCLSHQPGNYSSRAAGTWDTSRNIGP